MTTPTPTPRDLPSVQLVLNSAGMTETRARLGREAALRAVRAALDEARDRLVRGLRADVDPERLADRAADLLAEERPALRRVLNASGILLHTGLGRAPLAAEALEAVVETARGYCNLELDLDSGERGKRASHVADLICRLTGAEAATVVNNNAAATVLALRALAFGREAIVSRGQLIEIGGSFRLPEIFAVSGARLVEVGTTNQTRLDDYERAVGPESAVLLRVHPSNFRVVGFTGSVEIGALVALARSRGLRTIDDVGSGALGAGLPPLIEGEPTITGGVSAGADLVLASGDKLLGGPQAGLIVGRRDAVALVEADPLARAVRVDKMTLAALEATLRLALDSRRIPLWSFLTTPLGDLFQRAEALAQALRDDPGLAASAVATTAFVGGGSLPGSELESAGVRVVPPSEISEGAWARTLRLGTPPVVGRVQGGAVWFDLRAIDPLDDEPLLDSLRRSIRPRIEGSDKAPSL